MNSQQQAPLAGDRQARIVDLVRARRSVRVSELAAEFAVSSMTVRRDIDALEELGILERVHGGARLPLVHGEAEPDPIEKSMLQRDEKRAIARAAAQLVRPGSVVGIGAGTTTLELAKLLVDAADLTVVTNSIGVAEVLRGAKGVSTVITGGVRTISDSLVGPIAASAIRQINVDLLVLGTHGLDADKAFTAPNLLEAEGNREFMARAARSVIVTDSTKWGVVGLTTYAGFDDVDLLISDTGLPQQARAELSSQVRRVLLADPASSEVERLEDES